MNNFLGSPQLSYLGSSNFYDQAREDTERANQQNLLLKSLLQMNNRPMTGGQPASLPLQEQIEPSIGVKELLGGLAMGGLFGDNKPKRIFDANEVATAPTANMGNIGSMTRGLSKVIPNFYNLPLEERLSIINQSKDAGVLGLPGSLGERKAEFFNFRLPSRQSRDGEKRRGMFEGQGIPTLEELEKNKIRLAPWKYDQYKGILDRIYSLREKNNANA